MNIFYINLKPTLLNTLQSFSRYVDEIKINFKVQRQTGSWVNASSAKHYKYDNP